MKGAKSEDTIAVGADDHEILTSTPEWPSIEVEIDGRQWTRPAIRQVG